MALDLRGGTAAAGAEVDVDVVQNGLAEFVGEEVGDCFSGRSALEEGDL